MGGESELLFIPSGTVISIALRLTANAISPLPHFRFNENHPQLLILDG
jgi:hypothetical protein